jgi:TonB family protein
LLLRNFYSRNNLEFDQDGVLRSGEVTPGPWTLAGIEITRIAVAAQGVEVLGHRLGISYASGKRDVVKLHELKIHVAKPVSDVDAETVLDPIFSKIFIDPDNENLSLLVPTCWRPYLAGTDPKSTITAWEAILKENGISAVDRAGTPTPPRVLSSAEPKYTKEGAAHNVEGTVILELVVDTTGQPVEIAIARPLGMGLDEQAVLAVTQWRFRPSTLNGKPVRAKANLEIKFKCCP